MEVVDYKCLACGAGLRFDPTSQKWVCDYCNSSYNLEELQKVYGNEEKLKEEKEKELSEFECYNCPNCGAEIIMDDTTTATYCVYCGSNSIIKNKLKGEFNPSKIIPFKTTKKQAIEALEKYKKGKLFIPDEFAKPSNIEKISGIYIPFFIYDCDVDADFTINAKKVKSWSDFYYHYTKTDYYKLHRKEKMHFENIPVDGATKFPDDIMNSIEPYNYDEMIEFSSSYLAGFLSERYDLTMDELFENAKKRAMQSTEDEIKAQINGEYIIEGTSENNSNIEKNNTSEYVLLPVWMLNVKFKDEIYTFAMNGQTGKFIGNIPIDRKKFWKWWILVFASSLLIISAIVILLNLFLF